MIKKFRKKPIVIEAVQWTGKNTQEIYDFGTSQVIVYDYVLIKTLEGDMKANIGDYIIKGVEGEFYPCKPDIFDKTYEEVEQ